MTRFETCLNRALILGAAWLAARVAVSLAWGL